MIEFAFFNKHSLYEEEAVAMKRFSLKFLSALCVLMMSPVLCQAGIANIPDPTFYQREPPGGSMNTFLLTPLGNRIEIAWRLWENVEIDADTIWTTRRLRKALKARGAKDVSLRLRDEARKNPGCTIIVNAGSDKSRVRSGILYSTISCSGMNEENVPTPNTDAEFSLFANFIVEEVGKAQMSKMKREW